jgi:hypothetical protein
MLNTIRRTAAFTVPLPAERAVGLFTAEGERLWAEGWDPQYPAPERTDEVGAVFITDHGGHQTTWVAVDRRAAYVRYARVTAGFSAGTVEVELSDVAPGVTRASVTYDLTALSDAGRAWLETFDAHYDDEIAGWGRHIAHALEERGGRSH